jgi:uncharacterized protein with GYD domain
MPTFIMLTRLNADAVRSPRGLEQLERDAMKRVREECPDVEWLSSYAVLGPCDYLGVFIANDIETAARVSTLVRTFGHAQTEIWTATEWERFKEIVRTLPQKKRTAGHRKVLPKAFGLFTRYASLADPEIALLTEAIERLDEGLGKPHEQLMFELEIWSKSRRALLSATRKLPKPRP